MKQADLHWWQVLCQKRMMLILILGFASGLPLGLTGTTLQAWYALDGVSITQIGLLALVGQPYVYKFMWAPVMDRYCLPFLGRRKGWMLTTQVILILLLGVMALLTPAEHAFWLAVCAFLVAFASASQDIVIDAYRTDILAPNERGMGTSMAVSGYRIAMLVSSGLTLTLAHFVGFSLTYLIMAGLMGVGVLATLVANEPHVYLKEKQPGFLTTFIDPLKEFLTRDKALIILLFIMIYKMGDVFAGSLLTAFLIKGVGFSLLEIGATIKTVGLIATLAGTFVGGVCMIRLGLFRALFWFGIIQAVTNILYWVLAQVGPQYEFLVATVFLENFGGGLGTAAFMAFIMSLCDKRFTATQFALLSSISAIGRVYMSAGAGKLVDLLGWSEFFLWTILMAVPGLILLFWLKDVIVQYGQTEEIIEEAIDEAKAEA